MNTRVSEIIEREVTERLLCAERKDCIIPKPETMRDDDAHDSECDALFRDEARDACFAVAKAVVEELRPFLAHRGGRLCFRDRCGCGLNDLIGGPK